MMPVIPTLAKSDRIHMLCEFYYICSHQQTATDPAAICSSLH